MQRIKRTQVSINDTAQACGTQPPGSEQPNQPDSSPPSLLPAKRIRTNNIDAPETVTEVQDQSAFENEEWFDTDNEDIDKQYVNELSFN